MISQEPATAVNEETITWNNFVKFVRQLSHDLRNQLNAAELQAALVGELTHDPELKPELLRLRQLVSQLGTTLQQLSAAVAPPRPTLLRYAAKDLIADLQKNIARDFPQQNPVWDVRVNNATLEIDPGLLSWAVIELMSNAVRFGGKDLRVEVREENNALALCVHETKSDNVDPEQWHEPLQKMTHGHYGLGLRRARAILAAHGGELTSEFDPISRRLTSCMNLPCSAAEDSGSYNEDN